MTQEATRVLIIDDNMFSQQGLKQMFETHGYQVVGTAGDVKQATDLFQAVKPQIVTLDLILGHEDGFRALMILRRLDPAVRVIMISSDSHPLTIEQAHNLGAVGFVGKPVQWEQLKAALDEVEKN